MDDDDGPNFSYAYANTSAAPSWNPALRPDHEPEQKATTVAQQLQPSPQIIPQSKPVLEYGQDDGDDLPAIPTASAIPAHISNGIPEREPNSDDDLFDRHGSGEVTQSPPQPPADEINGDGVNWAAEEAARASNSWTEEAPPAHDAQSNGTLVAPQEAVPGSDATAHLPEEHPAEKYARQGDTTLLEDAVTESDRAPLMADAEPATDDWGNSGEVFDLGGMPQDVPLDTPLDVPIETLQAEAVGTTVGDQVIGNTRVGGNARDDIDWGNADGDDFFGGAAASQPIKPQQPIEHGARAQVAPPSETQPVAGADGTWDLDMDNDFLPDTDETPAFELDDDEGFLEDEPAAPVQQPVQSATSGSSTKNRYAPQAAQASPQPPANSYAAPGPQFTNISQMDQKKAAPAPTPAYGVYNQPSPYQQQPAGPPMPSHELSFADKSKGGYHSPYDLPDDIVASTRKRPTHRTSSIPAVQPIPPPPRSSSISSASAHPRPPPPSNMSAASLSPPSSGHSMQSQMTGMPPNAPPKPAAPAKAPSNEFFAELPVASKSRPSGRYTPQHGAPQHPPAPGIPPKERTASWSSLRNEVLPDSGNLISQLQQPDRLPVFPDQPTAPVRSNSLPVPQPAPAPPSNRYSPVSPPSAPSAPHTNTRYSPAPPAAPAANTRYSPAPPQAPHTPSQNHHPSAPPHGPLRPPFAPRNSSPLAYHSTPQQEESPAVQEQHANHAANLHAMHSAESSLHAPFKSHLEGVSEVEEQAPAQPSGPPIAARSETPPLRSSPSSAVSSPRKRSNYMPQYQSTHPAAPTPRAQSQSPSAAMKQHHGTVSYNDRPASAHGVMSPPSTFGASPAVQNVNVIPHRRQMSHDYEYIPPNDERAADPLQRWRGYPIFKWGLGGTVVTTFPKQIPRYGGGATMPMMKCSPGEVKIQSVKEAFSLSEDIAKFPGPLKAKGKKKDVSAWLARQIETLDNQLRTPGLEQSMSPEDLKRLEERTLLWKIMQVFIDNDGQLDGNATVEAAVRNVLSPESESSVDGEASFSTAADLVGISRSNTSLQAEPVDPRAVEEMRNLLTKGDREKAVWHAVDQRLWGHAMLLSSTLNKDVWKQVVQEFVQKEVKKIGRSNQALAVLYEIFAGNHVDCIDELVPASARAGFQMMSTDGAGSKQNALQGLDKWRETLSLVLNNRSESDATALLSLGRLLAGYGRVEAAHICFIFARAVTYFGGVDDQQSDIVLIGADHRKNPTELGIDLEPVVLTEVYEFGLSLSARGFHVIPHLQNYKLAHAYQLAEYGHRTDAQSYCDAIAAAMKSTTRISPYYNGSFVASLDDLSRRLSQSPKDGSSSWISKPSMDKVSSSLLSKFNSFIAGDDEDASSNHSGGADVGPFAKIAGDTPTLTPSQSSADLYGAYSGFGAPTAAPSAPVNSRYAPSNAYTPRQSLESNRSRYESQGRPSLESSDGTAVRAVSDSYMPSPQFSGPYTPAQPQLSPGIQPPQLTKSQSYSPLRAEPSVPQPSYGGPYQPTPPAEEPTPAFGGYQPPQASFDAPVESIQSFSGYEPPTSSYEPPSYEPYKPDQEDKSPEEANQKKKSFMDDDDDDLATRAAALKSKQKSDADRAADEAFRKAAEADAKRDAAAKKSGGWFGGWFKKDPNAPQSGPIKAKLGEENSFYYDPELKKWINKKAGGVEATKPMATPPPPKSGPPNRSVSGISMGPPSSLPSSGYPSVPPSRPPTSNPQRSSSMPPPMGIPGSRASTPGIPSDTEGPKPPVLMPPTLPAGSGPPSRPGTSMSNASSIDDLLGAPQARRGGAGKKKKAGRYVDVMAQK